MFFSKKKNEINNIFVFDIGSGSVAGAFVKLEKDKNPEIDFTFRSHIKEAVPGVPYERYFFSMIASLEEVVKQMSHNIKNLPNEIIIYLRSPWLASTSRTIKRQSKDYFNFNQEEFKKIIAKDNNDFIKEVLDSVDEHEGYEVIDQRIESVKINGYEVKNLPSKTKINSLTIKTFITISPIDITQAIEDVILLEINAPIIFKSFSRSICNLSNRFAKDLKDYIFFDVGSLTTEISVVKNCQVVETITLPQGYAHINDTLLDKYSVNRGLLDAFSSGHTNDKTSLVIEKSIASVKEKWVRLISESMDKFSGQLSLPSTLILMTEDKNPSFFANILKDELFAQYLITDKKFNVIIMNVTTFENVCNLSNCRPDALLMAESIDVKNKYYA